MKYLITALSIAAVITIIAGSCYYDKRDLVYPTGTSTCDTTNVTYSTTITGILSANCYSCHGGTASAGGGVVLDKYSTMQTYIKNGQLLNDIKQGTGANPMPKGGAKLDDCSINKIAAWINKGAPNN